MKSLCFRVWFDCLHFGSSILKCLVSHVPRWRKVQLRSSYTLEFQMTALGIRLDLMFEHFVLELLKPVTYSHMIDGDFHASSILMSTMERLQMQNARCLKRLKVFNYAVDFSQLCNHSYFLWHQHKISQNKKRSIRFCHESSDCWAP